MKQFTTTVARKRVYKRTWFPFTQNDRNPTENCLSILHSIKRTMLIEKSHYQRRTDQGIKGKCKTPTKGLYL